MGGILDGVRVLDVSTGIAGPLTAMLLGDHGADVVRIAAPDEAPDTAGHVVWQRGKRRVHLDAATADDRGALLDLAARADVLIESYRPSVATALGLEHADLH